MEKNNRQAVDISIYTKSPIKWSMAPLYLYAFGANADSFPIEWEIFSHSKIHYIDNIVFNIYNNFPQLLRNFSETGKMHDLS